MIVTPSLPRLRRVAIAFLLLTFICATVLQARTIDLNSNGMSDIWEQIYNAFGLDPNGDADGDGLSNLLESLAGTDPFDPNSVPR